MSPTPDPLTSLSVAAVAAMVRAREFSPTELVDSVLARIEELNPQLRALLTVTATDARRYAADAERRILSEDPAHLPPLLGIPFTAKDLIDTRGVRTTYGSPLFREHTPENNAVVMDRLQAAGAILIGKTNTPEFGLLGETRNLLGSECVNPWDVTRTSGGSSGGAAAAVAARLGPFGVGTDGAGSVVAPAAMCGVIGFKPTRGLIPHSGNRNETGLYSDTGLLVTTTDDARWLLSILNGPDSRDPLSRNIVAPESTPHGAQIHVAVTDDLGHFPVDDEVRHALQAAASTLAANSVLVEAATPQVSDPWEVYNPVFLADAWSSLGEKVTSHPDQFLVDARAEVEYGRDITQVDVVRALRRWWEFRWQVQEFFDRFDALLLPATATAAFPVGSPPARIGGQSVRPHWTTFMPFPVAWNLAGNPVVSVPVGFTTGGLPIGVLVVAAFGRDDLALRVASLLSRRPLATPADPNQASKTVAEEALWL